MNVLSAACLFYFTTKKILYDFIKLSEKYPIANIPPEVDRKKFYSKPYEMISEIYSIWDIINGKYGNNTFVRFDKNNGEHYAKIFLNYLKFLNEWYTFLKIQQEDGKFDDTNFIIMETFWSLIHLLWILFLD